MQFKSPRYVYILMMMLILGNLHGCASYKASQEDGPIKIVNLESLEAQVKKNMEKGAFGYIRGGAEDEQNMRLNAASFDRKYMMPRVLQGLESSDINIKTKFLNFDLSTPVIMAPLASVGLAHESAEPGMAKGTVKAGTIFSLSTYSSVPIEEVGKAIEGSPFFFQLYMGKDKKFNDETLKVAKDSGAKAIILTVDSPVGGYREDDIETNFKHPLSFPILDTGGQGMTMSEIYAMGKQAMAPEDIKYIKEQTGLPVLVKGIQVPEDAEIANMMLSGAKDIEAMKKTKLYTDEDFK